MWILSEGLIGALIGGGVSLGGTFLAHWLQSRTEAKQRAVERAAQREDERWAFQIATLTELPEVLTQVMRDVSVVHLADSRTAQSTHVYGGHLLPDGVEREESLQTAWRANQLTAQLLDEGLRAKITGAMERMNAVGMTKTDAAGGTRLFMEAMDAFSEAKTTLGEALRVLYAAEPTRSDDVLRA